MHRSKARRRPQPAPQLFLTRGTQLRATSFDPKTGAFSAVIATETPVLRRDFDGDYLEVLSIKPGAIRLGRLQSGSSPLLDSHRAGSARDQIGVVTDARIDSKQLIADARLAARDDVKPFAADLAGGTPPNVSVGYRVYSSVESFAPDGTRILTRTDWEPFEMSFVPIPADPQTHIRSLTEGKFMSKNKAATPSNQIDVQDDEAIVETRSVENNDQSRCVMTAREVSEAYTLGARHNLPLDFVRQHIDAGVSLNGFRSAILNRVAEESARISISPRIGAGLSGDDTLDNPDFLARSIGDALYARMSGKPADGAAQDLVGRSMLELGAMLCEARGERVSWRNRNNLASLIMTRAISTSDFPTLLMSSGNRVLLDAYKAAECPLKALARRRNAADFRALTVAKLSDAPRLLRVNEGGEVKYGARVEGKESFRLNTFARIFPMTREAIINDDLGAFSDASAAWGLAAANTEADEIVALFTANSGSGVNLDDGQPLYTAGRGNKGTTSAITVAALDEGRKAMRGVKGLDGKTLLSVPPKYLVVGSAKETEAEQFLAGTTPPTPADVNPFGGTLELMVEPRFAGNAWRLFGDPSLSPVLSIAYLNGADGPIVEQKEGWGTLGMEFRAVLDFGCGITEWRGTFLNPGN